MGERRGRSSSGHRIREAMKDDGSCGPLGGKGKIVADVTGKCTD
jgi:hypothetical protein